MYLVHYFSPKRPFIFGKNDLAYISRQQP